MQLKLRFIYTLVLAISGIFSQAQIQYKIIWVDEFSKDDQAKITQWLAGVTETVDKHLGTYPFPVNYYLHRKKNAGEPVPWAHTVRDGEEGVHFHVDPSYSLRDFQEDWTAPHEISHLSIPYIGREHMWFSEGYASYMQWRLLGFQGVFNEEETYRMNVVRIQRIQSDYDRDGQFVDVSKQLRQRFNYPAVYWGGACYFLTVDMKLQKETGLTLDDVIRDYQSNGRLKDDSLEELVLSLDKLSESNIFSETLKVFQESTAREVIYNLDLPTPE